MPNLNEQMRAGVSVQEVRDEYERQLNKRYEAGEAHVPVPDMLWATVNAILARRQHGSAAPDALDMQTIRERDAYQEVADKLAFAVAEHFGADIGEHSSGNCPWANALDLLNTKPEFIKCAGSGHGSAAQAVGGDIAAGHFKPHPATREWQEVPRHTPGAVILYHAAGWPHAAAEQPAAAGNALTDEQIEEIAEGFYASPTTDAIYNVIGFGQAVASAAIAQHLRAALQAGCKWPLCESKEVQEQVAEDAHAALYSGAPQAAPETHAYVSKKLRQNAQDMVALFQSSTQAAQGEGLTEALERIAAYIERRKKSRGLDIEHVHGFDLGPNEGVELLLSDIETIVAHTRASDGAQEYVIFGGKRMGRNYLARLEADKLCLDEFAKYTNWELAAEYDEDDLIWCVNKIVGSPNDRVWQEIGRGTTPREAIDAAMQQAASNQQEGA